MTATFPRIAALWFGLALSHVALAHPGDPIGTLTRVGAPQVGQPVAGDDSTPAVAIDGAGNFVVVWIRSSASQDEIFAQRFNAAGEALGSPFSIGPDPLLRARGDRPTGLSMAMSDEGRFVVAWQSASRSSVIHVRAFDPAGEPVMLDTPIVLSTSGRQFNPSVAIARDGSFAVSWCEALESNLPLGFSSIALVDVNRIRVQRFDAAGRRQGLPIETDTAIAELAANRTKQILNHQLRTPSIAIDQFGQMTVAWVRMPTNQGGGQILAQRYDISGRPTLDPAVVDAGARGFLSVPQVRVDASQRLVLVWQGSEKRDSSAYLQRFTAFNQPDGNRTPAVGSPEAYTPDMAVRPGGDLAVTYSGKLGQTARVQFFDAQLDSVGASVPLPTMGDLQSAECRIAGSRARQYVTACQFNGSFGDPGGIFFQRYSAE